MYWGRVRKRVSFLKFSLAREDLTQNTIKTVLYFKVSSLFLIFYFSKKLISLQAQRGIMIKFAIR